MPTDQKHVPSPDALDGLHPLQQLWLSTRQVPAKRQQ